MNVIVETKVFPPDDESVREYDKKWIYSFWLKDDYGEECVADAEGPTREEARADALKELKEVWKAVTNKLAEEGVFEVNKVQVVKPGEAGPPEPSPLTPPLR